MMPNMHFVNSRAVTFSGTEFFHRYFSRITEQSHVAESLEFRVTLWPSR